MKQTLFRVILCAICLLVSVPAFAFGEVSDGAIRAYGEEIVIGALEADGCTKIDLAIFDYDVFRHENTAVYMTDLNYRDASNKKVKENAVVIMDVSDGRLTVQFLLIGARIYSGAELLLAVPVPTPQVLYATLAPEQLPTPEVIQITPAPTVTPAPTSVPKSVEYKTYDYKEIARHPDKYMYEPAMFTGTVLQVLEGDSTCEMRIAIDDDYDKVLYAAISTDLLDGRILEKDVLRIYGMLYGTVTYETVLGAQNTLPAFICTKIEFIS